MALHLLQCFITKLGFFKSLQMTVIISSTMSVMTHSQEHDTQLVAARGERERERDVSSDFPASVDLLHLF